MARSEYQYQLALQQFFDDENFAEMISRTKYQLFEDWQHASKLDQRELIFAKLGVLEQLVHSLRAASDSIAFEKQQRDR